MNRWLRVLVPSAFVALSTGLAFLWGDFLMGESMGWWFAVQAACGAGLVVWCLVIAKRASLWRDAAVAALTLRIVAGLVFPTLFQPTWQMLIDDRAAERTARNQVVAVLSSDPAYRDLSASVRYRKCAQVIITGLVGSRADFDRLRGRIVSECPAVGRRFLCWNVQIDHSQERLSGCDNDLFPVGR